jgi:hypothetical protein
MIVNAKSVIVIHAVFSETNKQLKDQMVEEATRQIIQEAVDCGCNAVLGMAISIKEEKDGTGYLVKASGTPCLLMPAQILLSSSTCSKSSTSSAAAAAPLRQRQSSVDFACSAKVERAA